MEIQNQLVSYELAIKLKELNVKQKSNYFYSPKSDNLSSELPISDLLEKNGCSAFTTSELGEILPDNICINGKYGNLFISKGTIESDKWTVGYSNMTDSITPFYTEFREANTRAKMLIYLIENKLIKNNE